MATADPSHRTGDNSVLRYTDDNCGKMLINKFRQHRESGLYLDATLRVEGHPIRVHKAFLAAFSDYFANLFGSGLNESHQDEIVMADVDFTSLSRIIDFAYSGVIEISWDTVEGLLRTSDYLVIEFVRTSCCEYLIGKLDVTNVIWVLTLSESLNMSQLTERARCYAAEHISQILESSSRSEITEIPANLFQAILSDENLIVFNSEGFVVGSAEHESLVLDIVLRYVGRDNPQRMHLLPQLLTDAVRLPLCSRDRLLLLRDELNAMSPEAAEIAELALNPNSDSALWSRPRNRSGMVFKGSITVADTRALRSEVNPQLFDDSTPATHEACLYVTGMQLRIRHWDGRPIIGGMKVFYSTGISVEHGNMESAGSHHQLEEFHMEPGERIIGAAMRSGWMVDSVQFTTSRDRAFGPYGGTGGAAREGGPLSCREKVYLACVKGRVDVSQSDTAIRHLQFIWAYYRLSSEPVPVEPVPPRNVGVSRVHRMPFYRPGVPT